MSAGGSRFLKELRRRRVLRVAGLYVVGVWLLMQVADVVFPAWSIPGQAIRYLMWAALLGFPVALAFGWIFQLTPEGIRRTRPEWSEAELEAGVPLRRTDYLILAAFLLVIGLIGYDTIGRVAQTQSVQEPQPSLVKIAPNSVAVLPFASLSVEPEHEYFADGISEEILNRLSTFDELTVIARTSSFSFKDSDYDIARISGLLGVKYLLQGSVRRDGHQLRIAAQLVDQSGVQVWSNTFDRQLGAIFALQEEIAKSVATSIVPQIVPPSAEKRLPDLEAYQEYLVGREIMARRTSMYAPRAAERFTRAIDLDSEFAEPYAGRAIARTIRSSWVRDHENERDLAQRDIDAALALSPNMAQGYAAQALLDQMRNPVAHAEREALLRRTLALDPNLVDALNWLHGALSGQGRFVEAFEVLQSAVRIDPLAPAINSNLAMDEARRGRFEDAERRLLRQLEIPQPSFYPFATLAEIYRSTGRLVDATEMSKRQVLSSASVAGRPGGLMTLIPSYAVLGMWEAAEYWQVRYEEAWPEFYQVRLFRYTLQEGKVHPADALAGTIGILDAEGLEPGALEMELGAHFGVLQVLAGDHEDGIRTLREWVDPEVAFQGFEFETEARHALAWAWQQTGSPQRAHAMLALVDTDFGEQQGDGRLHLSGDIFNYALNTLLLGDTERALDLLDQAADAGWRGYYGIRRDPRWDAVREHPRFRAILAKVKADIDLQRASVEAMDAEDDFVARLDAQLALHADQLDVEAR
jgi:TolB-like protein/Tfp pilus assembly protein PilF